MDLFTTARKLEARIARSFETAAQRVDGAAIRGPLELLYSVVDIVEHELVPAGRGRRVFPYNSVTVMFAARLPEERARLDVVIEGPPTLRDRICDRVRARGAGACDMEVNVVYAAEAEAGWRSRDYHVEFARVTRSVDVVAVAPATREPIQLTVTRGVTPEPAYSLTLARIELGRGVDVRDTRDHLLRTNHVAFTEGAGEVNRSVSRRHAHITCDAGGAYRIYDDGSAHGTRLLRDGSTIVVRSGSRGVRLREGDEIVLGEARIVVGVQSPK